jgi:hypothetical protein
VIDAEEPVDDSADSRGLLPPADTSRVRGSNPLLSIWFFPRQTIRLVVRTNPGLHLAALFTLNSFFNVLNRASGRNMGDHFNVWMIVGFAMLIAPLAIPFSAIGSWMGEWVASTIGGVATREQIRASYAWAAVPVIAWALVFWPLQLALFGTEVFSTNAPTMTSASPILLFLITLTSLVASVWSIVIGIQAFAEVNQFSALRSVGAALQMFAVILLPVIVLFGMVEIFKRNIIL